MEKSKRSEETLNTRMKHEYDDGLNEDTNSSRLEPKCACIYQGRQSKDNDTN